MKILARLFIISALTSAPFFVQVSSGEIASRPQQKKEKLDDLSRKIQEQKIEIEKVEHQEALVIEKLNAIETQLMQENKEYDTLTVTIENIQKQMNEARGNIENQKKEKNKNELYLKKRLRASYKHYRRGMLRILLSSPTYSAFIRQEKFLNDILSKDHGLFMECRQALELSKKYQEELTVKKDDLLSAKEQLAQKRETIKESHREKIALLETIKHEKSLQLNALEELEKYSKELQAFVDRLPQERETFTSARYKFSVQKGKLRCPVKGKIISSFGRTEHPELHTSTFQKGIEIECPMGTAILSIYDGKVVYADWFKGYGYTMIIDHGENYYSLVAHASKLLKNVGDFVAEGETIALVGDTNSIKGACLYFEIRYHGKPQDPLTWLKNDFT
ncbi:MAG: peptidoglycan DD-metalloendopeptidase family protein [Pseudomonadota bacterium]